MATGFGKAVRRHFGDSRPLWGGLESGDDSPLRRNPGHPKAIHGYVVGSRRTRAATFRCGLGGRLRPWRGLCSRAGDGCRAEHDQSRDCRTESQSSSDGARSSGRRRTQKKTTQYPALIDDLKNVVDSATRGDPMSPLLWISRSLEHVTEALRGIGYALSTFVVRWTLKSLGYRLQANRKTHAGGKHPDRNAQFLYILCSRDNPKILRRYHAKIVCDCAAIFGPVSGDVVSQETQGRFGKLLASAVGLVVGDILVHHAPEPLDRVQVRAVGGEEVQLDPASGPRQPFADEFGVMIACVVEEYVDVRHHGVQHFQRFQQSDR